MYIEGKTGLSLLAELLSDISDKAVKISKTINQQLYFVNRILTCEIIKLQWDKNEKKAGLYLDKMKRGVAEVKTEIIRDLIPSFELCGDQKRLTIVKEILTMLDELQLSQNSVNPSKIL